MAGVAIVACVGCGGAKPVDPAKPSSSVEDYAQRFAPVLPPDPGVPFHAGDIYTGSYTCQAAQGKTELQLKVRSVSARDVVAIFAFDFGHGDAIGQFEIHGTWDPQAKRISFVPGREIDMPAGFKTVGLTGAFEQEPRKFSGNIDSPLCGSFFVELSSGPSMASMTAPPPPPTSPRAPSTFSCFTYFHGMTKKQEAQCSPAAECDRELAEMKKMGEQLVSNVTPCAPAASVWCYPWGDKLTCLPTRESCALRRASTLRDAMTPDNECTERHQR